MPTSRFNPEPFSIPLPNYNTVPNFGTDVRQGLGDIATTIQRNRDYAAALAKQREDARIAREGLAVRQQELAGTSAYQKGVLANAAKGNEIDAARYGLRPVGGGKSGYELDPTNPKSLPDITDVNSVRGQIVQLPSYKSANNALPVYDTMMKSAQGKNKTSDLQLIYGMAKIMDPLGSVRTDDYGNIVDTQGIGDKLNGLIKGVMGGAVLQDDVRIGLLNEARIRTKAYVDQYREDVKGYEYSAQKRGIDPKELIPSLGESRLPFDPFTAIPGAVPPPAPVVPGDPNAPAPAVQPRRF